MLELRLKKEAEASQQDTQETPLFNSSKALKLFLVPSQIPRKLRVWVISFWLSTEKSALNWNITLFTPLAFSQG